MNFQCSDGAVNAVMWIKGQLGSVAFAYDVDKILMEAFTPRDIPGPSGMDTVWERTVDDDQFLDIFARHTLEGGVWIMIERLWHEDIALGPYPHPHAGLHALNCALIVQAYCEQDCLDAYCVMGVADANLFSTSQGPDSSVRRVMIDLLDPAHTGRDGPDYPDDKHPWGVLHLGTPIRSDEPYSLPSPPATPSGGLHR